MFLMVLGERVILGADHPGKKESCPQSPLCMKLILNINESSFYMRPLSVLKYLHKANIVENLQGGREGVVYKNEQDINFASDGERQL